ncbi:MAG: response regulator transcription factor [Leptolyngbyaceae cyanobacterium]
MRCLLVGGNTFLEETSFLFDQTNYEISGCSFDEALTKMAINHPDIAVINLEPFISIPSFFLRLQQIIRPDQGSYCPILIGFIPHETSKEQHIKYYNIGFELVVEPPVDIDFLMARIKALIRRIGIGKHITQSQHLMLDRHTRDCFLKTSNGELLGFFKATPMQFDIIQRLVQYPRRIWYRDQFEAAINNTISKFDNRAVDTSINRLRERLREQLQKLPKGSWQINPLCKYPFIQTEYGSGYYFLDCLQLGKDLRAANSSLQPVRQGGFKVCPDNTRPFPFNIQDCAYSWDGQG